MPSRMHLINLGSVRDLGCFSFRDMSALSVSFYEDIVPSDILLN